MKLSNAKKHWKTTVMGIVGGLLMIAGIMYPDTIDSETGEAISVAIDEILTGVGGLIAVITGILAKDD